MASSATASLDAVKPQRISDFAATNSPSCLLRIVAMSQNVDAVGYLEEYQKLPLCCQLFANSTGQRVLRFTTEKEAFDDLRFDTFTTSPFPEKFRVCRFYELNSFTRLLLKGSEILFLGAIPKSNSQVVTRYSRDFQIKFKSEELARIFLRRVKGFIGGRVVSAWCQTLLTPLQEIKRRLVDVKDEYTDGYEYFRRVTWRQLPSVVQPVIGLVQMNEFPMKAVRNELKLFERAEHGTLVCREHNARSHLHDYADSVQVYSTFNDRDILAAVSNNIYGYLDPQWCSAYFEAPFNVPHILQHDDAIGTYCVDFDQKDMPSFEQIAQTLTNFQSGKDALQDTEIYGAPCLSGNVKLVWGLVLSTRPHVDRHEVVTVTARTFVPCCLLLPADDGGNFLIQPKVSLIKTQAAYRDRSTKDWTANDVILALTDKTDEKADRDGPAVTSKRWARMIPVEFAFDRYTTIETEAENVFWVLIIDNEATMKKK